MKVKPKEVLVNLPVVLLFNNEDDIPELASNFNTFLHGKVKLKYESLGALNGQFVGLFYLQRNDESQQLRDEFVRLIEEEQVIRHQQNVYFSTLTRENNIEKEKAEQNAQPIYTPSQHELHLCDCACHQFHIENSCMDCNCGSD